ncbi:type IV toxin-antitoxin system AbiEi family antitoxin domain-containing protein [Rhodococcus jostii]|uniref:type IV toxin-antitoxin system AbiEi family antitoxin domain-containing protein n=1 Tax=Rhodococcus jostii TaxID=132919 RepID=UPI00362CA2EA
MKIHSENSSSGRGKEYCRRVIEELAAQQRGLLTSAQARRMGLSSSRLAQLTADGDLERICNGVYRLPGAAPDKHVRLRVLWMCLEPESTANERLSRLDPGGVVSHHTAASMHCLGHVCGDSVEFATRSMKRSRRPGVRLHQADLSRSDWTVVDGLPVTTVLTTTCDLAQSTMGDSDFTNVVRDALVKYQVDFSQIGASLS